MNANRSSRGTSVARPSRAHSSVAAKRSDQVGRLRRVGVGEPRADSCPLRRCRDHRRRRLDRTPEVQPLEQRVDEDAAVGRPPSPATASPGTIGATRAARQPEHPLDVEPVAAALVLAQRRVAERPTPAVPARRGRRRLRGRQQVPGSDRRSRAAYVGATSRLSIVLAQGSKRTPSWLPAGSLLEPPRRCRRAAPARATRSGAPGDRQRLELGRAAHDQPLARPRHRDVEQAALLARPRPAAAPRRSAVVVRAPDSRLRCPGCGQAQPEAPVAPDPHQLGAPDRGAAAEVGHADDRELEPLGAVDRHQPHRVERLALDRRLALPRADAARRTARLRRARGSRAGRGRRGLVLARQPHQLAHVGQPPLAAGHREHAPGRSRWRRSTRSISSLDARCGAAAARPRTTPRTRQLRASSALQLVEAGSVGLARSPHQGSRPRPRPAAASTTSASTRDADQRRGEHRVQRLLVARVGERAQIGDHVDDLRVRPVAAPADHVGRDAARPRAPARSTPQVGRSRGSARTTSPARRPALDQLGRRGRRQRAAPRRPATAPPRPSASQSAPLSATSSSTRRRRAAAGARRRGPATQRPETRRRARRERGVDDAAGSRGGSGSWSAASARAPTAASRSPRALEQLARRRGGSRRSTAARRRP